MSTSPITPEPPVPQPRHFLFRGSSVAAGGILTLQANRPVQLDPQIPTVHGETNLPVTGGVSRSFVESPQLRWPEFIEYRKCETSAVGAIEGQKAITTVTSSVSTVRLTTQPSREDNVPNVRLKSLQADRLSLSIRSIHSINSQDGNATFEVLGTPITDGLSLVISYTNRSVPEVVPIQLEYYERIIASNTLGDLDKQFRTDRGFFDNHAKRYQGRYKPVFGKSDIPRNQQSYVDCSIVRRIHRGTVPIEGNVLTEPGLGTVFFGEVLTNDYHRRLVLVRLEMGSDPQGRVTLCGPESNGGLD